MPSVSDSTANGLQNENIGTAAWATGNIGNFDSMIARMQQLVEETSFGHPDLAKKHFELGETFRKKYVKSKDIKDLEAALEHLRKAVSYTSHQNPEYLQSLADSCTQRYKGLGNLEDLELALQHNMEALELIPESQPADRAGYLRSVGQSYGIRFKRLGDLKDLKAASHHYQAAVNLTPVDHPHRALYLRGLAIGYHDQYQRLGDLNDLEAALQHVQAAVDLTPADHPERADYLKSLAIAYSDRYQRLGGLNDLEAALRYIHAAVGLTPAGHPDRASHLQNLAAGYGDRYQRLGDLNDLEAVLQYFQEAVDLTPAGHLDRAWYLQRLGLGYRDRYLKLGDLNDLETALHHFQTAVDLTPASVHNRAMYLQFLAIGYTDRYSRLHDLNDLNAALQHVQAAVDLTPAGHPNRAVYLQNLAGAYGDRYQRLRDLNDLEAALHHFQAAVDLTPAGHPGKAFYLQRLGMAYRDRYLRIGDLIDLEAGLQHKQAAVNLTPVGHLDRPGYLQNIALSLMDKYKKFKQPHDLESIQNHFTASLNITGPAPEESWGNFLVWASFAAQFQPEHCISAFRGAFRILPELLWIGHSIQVRHDALRRLDIPLATATAIRNCIHLSDIPSAVEIMEQGLGTVYQQMLQLKTAVDELPPQQAQDFHQYSMELYSKGADPSMSLVNKRNDLIEAIRKQPDFEYFLLPKPYKVLCKASQGGPVIILNSHKDGCDAVLVLISAEPIHVPLHVTLRELESQKTLLQQSLRRSNLRIRGESGSTRLFGNIENFATKSPKKCFEELLAWLWTGVVCPVYTMLEKNNIHDGRLWWLPTGAFTGFPVHACPPTDQFIHSYTATLGSLLDTYSKKSLDSTAKVSVTGVTDTGSGGAGLLPGVGQEVKNICSVVPLSQIECLQDHQATVYAVKLQLEHCAWVHLACHGTQDAVEPTKSHLLLYGGNLELGTILKMPLSNAQVVFLAACQTAMGDSELVNESIHLGGGFIAAGFRGAIGTMWSMNDWDGPFVAKLYYSHLFRDGRQPQASDAAEALHLAVKELKRQGVPYERWVPFIHMGI